MVGLGLNMLDMIVDRAVRTVSQRTTTAKTDSHSPVADLRDRQDRQDREAGHPAGHLEQQPI